MRMDAALLDASTGLESVMRQLATVSQNVANAGTAGYTEETSAATSVAAGGEGMGVRAGVATRSVDGALQQSLLAVGGQVAGDTLRSDTLAGLDAASGAPGSGQDVASLLGVLRDGFSTLLGDPSSEEQQRTVVGQAATLAQGVNGLGQAVGSARQQVQDGIVTDVATANAALGTVGTLSLQIVAARQAGQSTADLEDKRDTAEATVSQLTGAQFLDQPGGGVLAVSGGTVLPLQSGALSMGSTTLAPGSVAPALTIGGQSVKVGGRIGAGMALRDTELPAAQAGLDGFAQALASGFAAQGLALFTDGSGSLPPAGTAGFAQTLQVNPTVQATPSMVRDGSAGTGTGQAGDTSVISAVLTGALGSGAGTLAAQASNLVAGTASAASTAAGTLATDTAVQTGLTTRMQAQTGVSVDSEMAAMVQLQNSYGANAKVLAAVQTMWTQLLESVP